MTKTAVEQLNQSFLRPNHQLQGMSADVNLAAFHLEMRTKAGIHLAESITDATIDRTIEGASTLKVTVEDTLDRQILNSGMLGRKVDVEIDGLFFTLVAVSKANRSLTLTFEEREINVLRYHAKYMQRSRDDVTRAQFVVLMLKEVKELQLRYVIPELTVKQPISDVGPNDILVNGAGTALVKQDTTVDPSQRSPGIQAPTKAAAGLTVKNVPATIDQINNANTVLQTGQSMKARRKVLVCSIMTAIDESEIVNLVGGDRDSVGIFQQRGSQGWPATRNIPTDAAAFFRSAMAEDAKYPGLTYNDLCQNVQRSGTPYAYGQYQGEAEAFVNAYGVTGGDGIVPSAAAVANNQQPGAQSTVGDLSTGFWFIRGTISKRAGQTFLQKENSWDCISRLAKEVNWRAFCVSGAIYFISDEDLFKSKPFMTIDEDSDGVDWIDFDFDEGKRVATVTVTCHLARWSAPPGSTIEIGTTMGPILRGKWLVNDVSRSLYDHMATITLKKPQPVLPEPTTGTQPINATGITPGGGIGGPPPSPEDVTQELNTPEQQRIMLFTQKQLGLPYQWGAEIPGQAFDCSGLSQAAYGAAGISIPRTSQLQWAAGPKVYPPQQLMPADLVFFTGSDGTAEAPGHVGIYIGQGKFINAPYTGQVVRVDTLDTGATGSMHYVGATRAWKR